MSSKQSGSAAKTVITCLFGLFMAVAGYWVSVNWHSDFIQKLNDQGIPLDLGKTVSMLGMFVLLFPLLNFFYFKPLSEAIHGRTTELERTFSEADELRAEMKEMRGDYERRLADTEAKAREQIQNSIREAQDLRKTLMAEASERADALVRDAEAEIAGEKERVLTDLRLTVTNLALSAAEKVIGENMDTDKNRRLVSEFIDKVEVPG